MNRLTGRLRKCRRDGRLLLVGYLPAGWPSREEHAACVRAAFEAGVDAMEIAVPNPPRPLDGPLVQFASRVGADEVTDAGDALRLAVTGRARSADAVVVLVYRQAFEELGLDVLLALCVDAGADALLMPEHSLAEQIATARYTRAAGLEQVLFLYLQQDLPVLADSGLENPVIYLQSSDSRTGGRFDAPKARERLGEVREALGGADAYILVGFGIRGSAEVEALVGSSADGVIVGTSMVEEARFGADALGELVRGIRPSLPYPSSTAEVSPGRPAALRGS